MDIVDIVLAKALAGGGGGGSGLPDASGQADNTALSVQSGAWAASGAVLSPIGTEPVEVVAEQTVAFSDAGGGIYLGGIAGDFSINVGDTLTVNWDGTPYTCVAVEFYGSPTWGNFSIDGAGADTGEPFLMGATPGRGIEMETLSTAASHTIGLSQGSQAPADGSIMIIQNGAWVAASLADLVNAIVNP